MSFDFKQFLELEHNKNKKVQKLPERKLTEVEHTLLIDSRHRNRTVYSNSNSFIVKFDSGNESNPTIYHKYKNISKIFLTHAVLPKRIVTFPYLILDIPEIQSINIAGTNDLLNRCFAILIPEHHHNDGDFVNCNIQYIDDHKHIYKPPIASLPQTFSISIYEPSGSLANLGTDNTASNPPKETVQAFFIFKVYCQEESFEKINSYMVN